MKARWFERLTAHVDPDAPARTRLVVPKMPPANGQGCCWGCTPEQTNRECLIHASYVAPGR